MFKARLAIIFSVIAGLVVFIVALATDARILTAFMRGFIGFLIGGVSTFLILFLLENRNIVVFDKEIESYEQEVSDMENESGQEYDEGSDENKEEAEFMPMTEDSLEHMDIPKM